MKLYRFLVLKTENLPLYMRHNIDYDWKFVFASNIKDAKQKAEKYVTICHERKGIPFARVDWKCFTEARSIEYYREVFANWDGAIHADEDGVITIGKALL